MVAGWFWSAEEVTHQVEQQVVSVIGEGGWQQVRSMMTAADQKRSGGMAALLGIVVLIIGATGVMVQLQAALNRAWEVEPDPEQGGVQTFLLKRVLSLAMIIADLVSAACFTGPHRRSQGDGRPGCFLAAR